jgi:hypothetical protein
VALPEVRLPTAVGLGVDGRLVVAARRGGVVDAELLTMEAYSRGFLVAACELAALVMAGVVYLTVLAYRKKHTAVGVLLTIQLLSFVLTFASVLIGLVVGWVRARRWQITRFMIWWTALVLLAWGNLILAGVMSKMTLDEWRAAFWWLPSL